MWSYVKASELGLASKNVVKIVQIILAWRSLWLTYKQWYGQYDCMKKLQVRHRAISLTARLSVDL